MLPSQLENRTIIVAPLDWGMGHATRCIPLIRQFLAQQCVVIFAGNKVQTELIAKDFPSINLEIIEGYNVTLDSEASTYKQLFKQFKELKRFVDREGKIAEELVEKYKADVIISDNRYGFHCQGVTNILLTHQLKPQVPVFRNKVNKLIRKYLKSFDACWIPDVEDNSLCGDLIQSKSPIPIFFIGWLSRFQVQDTEIENEILVIVSGPQPERGRFQKAMTEILTKTKWRFKVVSPDETLDQNVMCNPATTDLEHLINSSEIIISRAGYTSIMELMKMKKTSILIPTKGQYEQEYFAQNIHQAQLHFLNESQLENFLNKLANSKKFA